MSLEKTWYSHAFGITTLSILPKKKKKIKGKGWGGGRKKGSSDPEIPDA